MIPSYAAACSGRYQFLFGNITEGRYSMKNTTDMTSGGIVGHLARFSLPLMLTNLGQQFYLIADASIVGRGVGVKALAAVGSADWLYWLILWSVMAVTQGFALFVSRFFGQKDYSRMNHVMAMSVLLSLAIGLFMTIAGLAAACPVLSLLSTPDDIIGDARLYLMTMISGTVVVTVYNMSVAILRAFGNGRAPLVSMIIAGIMNVLLDLLFVLVFRWGVFGAAFASIIAQIFSFLYCVFEIRRIECVRLDRAAWRLDLKMIWDLLCFGLPLAVQYILIAVSGIILQSSINVRGSAFIAGFTATNKLYGLLECTAMSLGLAFATFTAQNYGAGNHARIKRGVKVGIVMSMVLSLFVSALSIIFSRELLQVFIAPAVENGTAAVEVGRYYLLVMAYCLLILFPIHIYRNAMQSLGNSTWAMYSGIAECITRAGMGTCFVWWFGTKVLYYIEPSAWIAAFLFIMIPYYFYEKKLLFR